MQKMKLKVASRRNIAVLSIAILAASEASFGQSWSGLAGDGLWGTGGNWSPAGVPASGTSTGLTFGGTATINSTNNIGAFTVNSITFANTKTTTLGGTNVLTFDGASPTIYQNGAGNATFSSPVVLNVDTTITGTGTGNVNFSGGINGAGGLIQNGLGTVHLTGTTNSLYALTVNSGSAEITGGTYTFTSSVASLASGLGLDSGGGESAVNVGNTPGQSGVVTIDGGAQITASSGLWAGNADGATGTINITGAGTSVNATTGFPTGRVGVFNGTGTFNVSAGASVTSEDFDLGRGFTADTINASSTFTGAGTTGNFQQMLLGSTSNTNASLTISNGATVTAGQNGHLLAVGEGFNDNVELDVNGGTLVASSTGGTVYFGFADASSTVNADIVNGGQFTVGADGNGGALFGGLNGSSTMNIGSGGALVDAGQVVWGFQGGSTTTMNVNSGGSVQVINSGLFEVGGVAFQGGSTGTITVNAGGTFYVDASSLLNFGDQVGLDDGSQSTGIMVINGGTLNADGLVTLGNPFTNFDSSNSVGQLVVQNGGTANFTGGLLIGVNFLSGFTNFPTQQDDVTVTGTGTVVTIAGEGLDIADGQPGITASLTISNGATLTEATSTYAFVGTEPGSTGTLTVTNNSVATIPYLQVADNGTGVGGTGIITVSNNSALLCPEVLFLGTSSTVTVTGSSVINVGQLSPATAGSIATIQVDQSSLVVAGLTEVSNGGTLQFVPTGTPTGKSQIALFTASFDFTSFGASSAAGVVDLTTTGALVRGDSLATISAELAEYISSGGSVGIGSSSVVYSANGDPLTGLGVIVNDDGTGKPLYPLIDGITALNTDVLILYTYVGDTTLKGYVDSTDLANTLAGLNGGLTGWENGDFDFNPSGTDATDLAWLLNALANQGAPFGGVGGSGVGGAVPEPAAIAPVVGLAMLGGRRRRR